MRVFAFSSPGGHVASICEKGDRLQIASLLRMTQRTITPSSYSQSLHLCVCVWEKGIRVCNVTRLTVVLDSLWP